MSDNRKRMYVFWQDDAIAHTSSTTRAINVANAAPRTPIAGAPSKPKINIAFRTIFSTTVVELIQAVRDACSLTFMIAK